MDLVRSPLFSSCILPLNCIQDTTQASQTRCFISYFDLSTNFPWRDPRPEQIERRRALLDDKLIFDLLLSSGGVKRPDALYPPTDVPSLRQLLDAIESSSYDALKKECLVYYLLKWHQDGREERFQIEHCIPPHFAALSDAYWLLDTGTNVPRAISILSDARLNKDYPSKILKAISLLPNHSTLLVKYVRTAKPTLTEVNDLETYVTALAESSLSEAWGFQRTFGEANTNRSRLFKKLLEWCVTREWSSR
ncbi:hypothetical protein AMATHDRAFT_146491 [Amanita thiersii Skay4041]|uniref:ELYS-like domain-containing protein n=1 Tax=Amanita thiersii Skay4041 TaxID=703135 RepID=A0A2A9NQC6_9AGAR|nr:hypothetical protein AMATHDRAFT_146491 [Amanita thiersii Skay4041]